MKFKLLLSMLSLTAIIGLTGATMTDSGKAGKTGSPGESTCVSCHSDYALNSGSGTMVLSGIPATYTPGDTYHMTLTIAHPGAQVFGLGLEALNTSRANAGTFTITNSTETHTLSSTVSGVSRMSVVQQLDGGFTPDSHAFNFDWTAPAGGAGNVTFWFASVAGDHDGTEFLDYVYSDSLVVPESTVGINEVLSSSGFSISPNPITSNMNIQYRVNSPGKVTMELYDLTGRLINQLFSAERGAGTFSESVDMSNYTTGAYMLRVISGSESHAQKIMVR
jgi:hypothetical protein